MFIVWGSGMYGKVDEIPGIGYVRTKFGHLYYFPLIPTASYFVTGEAGEQFSGASLALSGKSIVKAYVWSGLVVATVLTAIAGGASLNGGKGFAAGPATLLTISVLALIVCIYFAGKLWKTASYERACEIAEQLNFDPQLRIFVDLQYERISEQQADEQLDELSASLADFDDLSDEIAASGLDQTHSQN